MLYVHYINYRGYIRSIISISSLVYTARCPTVEILYIHAAFRVAFSFLGKKVGFGIFFIFRNHLRTVMVMRSADMNQGGGPHVMASHGSWNAVDTGSRLDYPSYPTMLPMGISMLKQKEIFGLGSICTIIKIPTYHSTHNKLNANNPSVLF